MRKNIFGVVVLFASLALMTACNSKPQPCEKHTWGDWQETTAATCTEKGEKTRTCTVCGEKETTETKALGHNFDDGTVTKEATCGDPGVKTFHCTRCEETKTEPIYVDHTWATEGTEVEGEANQAAYKVFNCTKCTAKKIEFAAKQATGKSTISGSLKSDSTFPDYMKLGTNGDYVSYTFALSGISGEAKIYMRGVMDFWHDGNNENQDRNFFSGKNNSDGNFKLEVNGTAVDYSWSKDLKYEDMLPGEAQGSYSALGDALVGTCTIKDGENTVKYTRQESYNMVIKDFVIVVG